MLRLLLTSLKFKGLNSGAGMRCSWFPLVSIKQLPNHFLWWGPAFEALRNLWSWCLLGLSSKHSALPKPWSSHDLRASARKCPALSPTLQVMWVGHGVMSGTNFKKNRKSKTWYLVDYKLVSFMVTIFDLFFISFLISFFWKMKSKTSKETTWKTTRKTPFFKKQLSCLFLMCFCFSFIFHVWVSSCLRAFRRCPFFFFFPDTNPVPYIEHVGSFGHPE